MFARGVKTILQKDPLFVQTSISLATMHPIPYPTVMTVTWIYTESDVGPLLQALMDDDPYEISDRSRLIPTRDRIERSGAAQKVLEADAEPDPLRPDLWTVARLDVRCGRSLTRGMAKPYDPRFGATMLEVARHMVATRHALGAFVQSDEITLVWPPCHPPHDGEDPQSRLTFGGRRSKWLSTLAGEASSVLTSELIKRGVSAARPPHMDCRIIQGDVSVVTDSVSWRADDAFRNGIQSAGQAWFGRRRIHGWSSVEILRQILNDGTTTACWKVLPHYAMHGAAFVRVARTAPIDENTRLAIPQHARPEVGTLVTRTVVEEVSVPELIRAIHDWAPA